MGSCTSKTLSIIESIDLADIESVREIIVKYYDKYDSLNKLDKNKYDEAFAQFTKTISMDIPKFIRQ